jgi:CBS domain-containing protein
MQVEQVMSQPIDVTDPTTTSREAARRMRDQNIGSLPVGQNGQLTGIATDRDIVVRAVAENSLPSNTAVRAVTSEASTIVSGTRLSRRRRGSWRNIRYARLPVLNRNQLLVGIIAIADIARAGDRDAEDTAVGGVYRSHPTNRRVEASSRSERATARYARVSPISRIEQARTAESSVFFLGASLSLHALGPPLAAKAVERRDRIEIEGDGPWLSTLSRD